MNKYYLYFHLGLITLCGPIQPCCTQSADVIVKSCDPARNERWKERRGKCGKCTPCEAKKGIDLNSIPINFPKGPHGYTKCLKCVYCPTHFYARDSICQPCNVDKCVKLNRHTHTECSLDNDVICSSTCLTGFHSEYGENDYKFPCAPDATTSKTSKPNTTTPPSKHISTKRNELLKANSAESNLKIFSPKDKQTESHILLTVVAGIVVVAIIVALVSVYGIMRYKRSRSTPPPDTNKNIDIDPSSRTKLLQSGSTLSNDNDLEIDGKPNNVRGELPQSITEDDLPFSENDATAETAKDQVVFIKFPTQPAMFTKTICHCTKETCEMCFKDYGDITVDIYMIGIVATNVCHHPEGMFHELDIPHSVIFGKSDDRNRDVENISEPEYITQVFKYWKRNQNATLTKLSKALCNQGFHHINDLLYIHYCKTYRHPKIHKLQNISCICTIQEDCEKCQTEFSERSLGDEFCDIITTNLCHRPETLFLDIGIPDYVICAKKCGRAKDRHVLAGEHHKTMFINCVKDETIKPKITLKEVSKMLCKHGYHHINDKLYKHYCKLYPSTVVTIPESSLYTNEHIENGETFEYSPSL